MTDLKSELDKLAVSLLKDVSDAREAIETKIDVFKAICAYHLGTQRVSKGKSEDDEGKPSFKDILNRVGFENTEADTETDERSAETGLPGHR